MKMIHWKASDEKRNQIFKLYSRTVAFKQAVIKKIVKELIFITSVTTFLEHWTTDKINEALHQEPKESKQIIPPSDRSPLASRTKKCACISGAVIRKNQSIAIVWMSWMTYTGSITNCIHSTSVATSLRYQSPSGHAQVFSLALKAMNWIAVSAVLTDRFITALGLSLLRSKFRYSVLRDSLDFCLICKSNILWRILGGHLGVIFLISPVFSFMRCDRRTGRWKAGSIRVVMPTLAW